MNGRKHFIKASIAVLIGIALMFVPRLSGVRFYDISAAAAAVIAALFGPAAGLITSFFEGIINHDFLSYYQIFLNELLHGAAIDPAFYFDPLYSHLGLLYGLSIGMFWKYFDIDAQKSLTVKTVIQFNLAQITANFIFRFLPSYFYIVYFDVTGGVLGFYISRFFREITAAAVLGTLFMYMYIKMNNRRPADVPVLDSDAG
jgi:uncharacterized membrane protein